MKKLITSLLTVTIILVGLNSYQQFMDMAQKLCDTLNEFLKKDTVSPSERTEIINTVLKIFGW